MKEGWSLAFSTNNGRWIVFDWLGQRKIYCLKLLSRTSTVTEVAVAVMVTCFFLPCRPWPQTDLQNIIKHSNMLIHNSCSIYKSRTNNNRIYKQIEHSDSSWWFSESKQQSEVITSIDWKHWARFPGCTASLLVQQTWLMVSDFNRLSSQWRYSSWFLKKYTCVVGPHTGSFQDNKDLEVGATS